MKLPITMLTLALPLSHSSAQTPLVLVRDGDAIATVGNVTSIDNLVVNLNGSWIVEADTDNPMNNLGSVLLRDGATLVRQGDALVAPVGAVISSFDAVTLNTAGESGWSFFLSGPPTNASGIYLGTDLTLRQGTISTATGFAPNTPYVGFFETKFNDARQILVVASVDDPTIASTVDRAVVRLQVSASGLLQSETVISKEGDNVPGFFAAQIADIGTGTHEFALNAAGESLYSADLTGATGIDGVILRDGVVMIREGDPAPTGGELYEVLYGRHLDLSDSGDWVVIADLTGATNQDIAIIKNGVTVVAREGQPAIGAFTLTGFGTGPVRIDSRGDVFWFGAWNDPDTTRDTGIFRNGQLLVQEGVTVTSAGVVSALASVENSFAISPDGRWLIFEGQLAGGVDAAFLMDLYVPPELYCFGDGSGTTLCPCANFGAPGRGCASSVSALGAQLQTSGTSSLSADTLTLLGSDMPNSFALYFQGTSPQNLGMGGVFGDGLRCVQGAIVRLGTKMNSAGVSQYPAGDLAISIRGAVSVPATRYYQVWYRNAAAFCTSSTFNLTNGVRVTWIH